MSAGPDPGRVREVFDEAADLPSGEREDFLARACSGEPAVAQEVRSLLGFLPVTVPAVCVEPAAQAPAQIGRFVVDGKLGQGGMGVVYRGYDGTLDRQVALKLVSGRGGRDAQIRLQREAQALARVAHPNVVPVYEVGSHGDGIFIAMELVRGATLSAWLRASPRTWREILRVVIDAGRGLAAAHRAGILHRDVKPDNVLVGDDGRARVVDFGLARGAGDLLSDADAAPLDVALTRHGAVVGTHGFMSPEHFGGTLTPLADQWSFAVTAYHALWGRLPYAADDLLTMRDLVSTTDPPPPPASDVPASVAGIVLRALSPMPEHRFATLDEMLDDLEVVLAANPDEDRELARRQRHGVAIGMVGLGTANLLFAGARTGWRFDLEPAGTVLQGVLGLVTILVCVAVFRKALWRTPHDRRVIALFATVMATLTLHRALSLDGDVREILRGDAVFVIGFLLFGALTVERWFVFAALLEAIYIVVAELVPALAVPLFGTLLIGTVALGIWFWREPKPISASRSGASSRAETRPAGRARSRS